MNTVKCGSRATVGLLACALGLIACGANQAETKDYPNSGLFVEAPFQQYFDSFQAEFKTRTGRTINNLSITFAPTRVNEAAFCEYGGAMKPMIRINRDSWDSYRPLDREAVIYHELGHCILGLVHRDDMILNPIEGGSKLSGSLACLNIVYSYRVMGKSYIPITLMHPCSTVASYLYSFYDNDSTFANAMRSYYINELFTNRVRGFDSGF